MCQKGSNINKAIRMLSTKYKMALILRTFILVVTICVCQGFLDTGNLFQFDCPIGCADSVCYSFGCSSCVSGYCLKSTNSPRSVTMYCVPEDSCGEGKYCYNGVSNVCTSCSVDHCDVCAGERHCKTCKSGYSLDDSSSYRSSCVSIYGKREGRNIEK